MFIRGVLPFSTEASTGAEQLQWTLYWFHLKLQAQYVHAEPQSTVLQSRSQGTFRPVFHWWKTSQKIGFEY
jgi:hypothetical protein